MYSYIRLERYHCKPVYAILFLNNLLILYIFQRIYIYHLLVCSKIKTRKDSYCFVRIVI